MTPRTFPAAVSTMGPSYFEEESTPKASAGIRPLKRAPAAAAPPPNKVDFISARRPTLIFKKSFRGWQLFIRFMDLAPVRLNHGFIFNAEIGNSEMDYSSKFSDCSGIAHFWLRSAIFRARKPRCSLAWQASQT